jgi:UDP-glucuronate 4-epimerase
MVPPSSTYTYPVAGAPQVVIVTGGAGYIGSHVCEALLHRGDAVVALDALTSHYDPRRKRANLADVEGTARAIAESPDNRTRWPRGNFRFLHGDVRRPADLDAAFAAGAEVDNGTPVRRVIHLAARAGVRGPLAEATDYVSLNVDGTTQILDACRRHGLGSVPQADAHHYSPLPDTPSPVPSNLRVGHLVLASSSTVYGSGPPGWSGPFSEDLAADRPLSVYGATKRAGELLAYAYSRLAGLNVTCLRFFGVVGPRARADLSPFSFTDAVWHGRPIDKFGDGTTARDYTYVGDIVSGVLAALDRFELAAAGGVAPGEPYECINLGNDHPVTLNDYLAILERLVGKPVQVKQRPEHPMDAKRTWADLAKARRLLGYEPQTTFEQALASCVEWYKRDVVGSKASSPNGRGVEEEMTGVHNPHANR